MKAINIQTPDAESCVRRLCVISAESEVLFSLLECVIIKKRLIL